MYNIIIVNYRNILYIIYAVKIIFTVKCTIKLFIITQVCKANLSNNK